MDYKQMEGLYTDEQLGGSDLGQAFQTQLDNRLKQLHTSLPGVIKSFDANTGTASVQPTIQRVWVEDGPKNLPLIENVLVQFPSGGDWACTFPVSAGDECIVIFFERAMDYWYQAGGIQSPSTYRLHSLSDAVCIPGIRSLPRALSNVQTDGVELRNTSRSIYLKVKAAGIEIKGNVTITGTVTSTGDVVANGKSLDTHTHSDPQGGTTGTPT